MTTAERTLRIFLRTLGASSLLALVFVVAPHAWMDSIHAWLGLGRFPDTPVVGYLARSLSGFYALVGGLLWVVSCDLKRNRGVLRYLGAAIALFGVVLIGVDVAEGLPLFWTIWEGPCVIVFGIAILFLTSRIPPEPHP